MRERAIRWGVMGAADIARTALCPAIQNAEHAVLTALATSAPEKAARFTARHPGLRVHEGYDTLLADPEIDAIYIPLPNHLHVEWTERALNAGKHVLCEKPIALRADQIDRLIALRDQTGLLAAEATMVVHHPQWHRVRELLADGAIGPLRQVQGSFTYRNLDPEDIRNRAEFGGGGLRDIGVYPSVTTRFATGAEPERIAAQIEWENGVDTAARVWADFPGFSLSFYCGMRLLRRQEMVFHGERGWLRLSAPFNAGVYGEADIEWQRDDGTAQIERFPAIDQYQLMIEAFGAALRGEREFACPLEFSRGNQAMIDAIFDAGAKG